MVLLNTTKLLLVSSNFSGMTSSSRYSNISYRCSRSWLEVTVVEASGLIATALITVVIAGVLANKLVLLA